MNTLSEKLKVYPLIAKGIFIYKFYGPPRKSWDLKTWLVVYILRYFLSNSSGDMVDSRERLNKSSATFVKNSKTENVIIKDNFRQRAHEVVKDHLSKVYVDNCWYGAESHWSNSPPLEPEWIIPNHLTRTPSSKVILYIHGGGYIFGHFSKYRSCLERLAQNTDSIVLGAHYRLSPDYSAPCQLEDILSHILYLTSPVEDSGIGLSFDQIIVSGDSAGGGLSSILNHFMRDANIGKLAGAILYSPWLDLKTAHPSNTECAPNDFLPPIVQQTHEIDEKGKLLPGMFTNTHKRFNSEIQSRMVERGHHFAPIKYLNSPLISPLCDTKFRDLPPILIITGEVEVLRDDSYLYQELINSSYSEEELANFKIPPSTLHYYEDMFHVFPMILPALPSSRISVKRASNFIKQCFGQSSDNFSKIREECPINEGIAESEHASPRPKKWRDLYLSTANNHQLIPFSPTYKRHQIQSWGSKSDIIEQSKL